MIKSKTQNRYMNKMKSDDPTLSAITNLTIIKCVISLVLLLPIPSHCSSISGNLEPNSNLPDDSAQHIYRRMTGEDLFTHFNLNSTLGRVQYLFGYRNHWLEFDCVSFLERFPHDKVITTILNINDSNAAEVFNNFNVSRDDVLRRIQTFGQSQPNNMDSRTLTTERHIESEPNWNSNNDSTRLGTDSQQE